MRFMDGLSPGVTQGAEGEGRGRRHPARVKRMKRGQETGERVTVAGPRVVSGWCSWRAWASRRARALGGGGRALCRQQGGAWAHPLPRWALLRAGVGGRAAAS